MGTDANTKRSIPNEAERIRNEMQRIRGRLPREADDIVTSAKEMVNWRHYVQRLPWVSIAAAAAVGFLAVPRKLEVIRPDVETLEKLAKRQKLVIDPARSSQNRKPGLVESAFNFGSNMAMRAAMAYAGQYLGQILGHEAADDDKPGAT